jgi:hypothetical protein
MITGEGMGNNLTPLPECLKLHDMYMTVFLIKVIEVGYLGKLLQWKNHH